MPKPPKKKKKGGKTGWNGDCREALAKIIEKKLVDPTSQSVEDIDACYRLDPVFEPAVTDKNFRVNFKNCCKQYLEAKALSGSRRRKD